MNEQTYFEQFRGDESEYRTTLGTLCDTLTADDNAFDREGFATHWNLESGARILRLESPKPNPNHYTFPPEPPIEPGFIRVQAEDFDYMEMSILWPGERPRYPINSFDLPEDTPVIVTWVATYGRSPWQM